MKISDYLHQFRSQKENQPHKFEEYSSVFKEIDRRKSISKYSSKYQIPQSTKNKGNYSSKSPNNYAQIAENKKVLQKSQIFNRRIKTEQDDDWSNFVETQKKQLEIFTSHPQPIMYIDLSINQKKQEIIPLYIDTDIESLVKQYTNKYDLPYSKSQQLKEMLNEAIQNG